MVSKILIFFYFYKGGGFQEFLSHFLALNNYFLALNNYFLALNNYFLALNNYFSFNILFWKI